MGRELKRTPVGFGWPLRQTWQGYLDPDWLIPPRCHDCAGSGYSPRYKQLESLWYGEDANFQPENYGSTPHRPNHPVIARRAQANIERSPCYYGTGQEAVDKEARRLAVHYNSAWKYHLDDDDVAALAAAERDYGFGDRLPAARDFNDAMFADAFSFDSSAAWTCIEARLEKEGLPVECATCSGMGGVEAWSGQQAALEAYEPQDPPTGDGWQMWENTSEGSPITPSFTTRDDLLDHLVTDGVSYFGGQPASREQWEAVVDGGVASVTVAPGIVVM